MYPCILAPILLLKPISRTFSVHMSRSNAPDLLKLLPLLPNLDTLEVLTEDYVEPSFEQSFKSVELPQIRTLVVDAQAHYLMKCCTHVKRVVIHRRGFDITYLKSIPFIADSLVYLAVCPPVPEIIQGVDVLPYYRRASDSSRQVDLVRLCPNLEELGVIQVSRVLISRNRFSHAQARCSLTVSKSPNVSIPFRTLRSSASSNLCFPAGWIFIPQTRGRFGKRG